MSNEADAPKKKVWIDDAMKDELKRETDMAALVRHFGSADIKPTGEVGQYKAKCIFSDCEDKKNDYPFGFNTEKKIFNCFHCGRKGDILSLIMQYQKVSFFEAKKFLLEWNRGETRANLKENLPSENITAAAETGDAPRVEKYQPFRRKLTGLRIEGIPALSEKGIKPQTAERFGVGYCSQGMMKGRVVVPVYDSDKPGTDDENILAYAGYSLTNKQKEYGDWKFPDGFEKGKQLFNLNRVIEDTKHAKETLERHGIIVVESFWNVLKLAQAGITNTVALMGCAMTTDQEKLLLSHTDKVKLWLDADESGVKGLQRILRSAKQNGNNGLMYKAHVKVISPENALFGHDLTGKEKPYQFTEDEIKAILKG